MVYPKFQTPRSRYESQGRSPLLQTVRLGRVAVFLFILLFSLVGLLLPDVAWAHHPLGGETPANALEGFMSGVGHPILGADHAAFVIAAGLLAAITQCGLLIPIAFGLAGLAGTGLHLMSLDLPAPEFLISASVLVFGVLLVMKQRPNIGLSTSLGAIAGLFHGYAYGESIIGAEMTPLVAYLIGFSVIQLAIALSAYSIVRFVAQRMSLPPSALPLRSTGLVICGAGAAFISSVMLG